jgi:hypothetical protein
LGDELSRREEQLQRSIVLQTQPQVLVPRTSQPCAQSFPRLAKHGGKDVSVKAHNFSGLVL